MLYELTQKSIISIDEYGNTTVLSTESCITPINVTKVSDSIIITQSQKDYNYITLGRNSRIQLNHGTRITVKYGTITVDACTHKTQLNRFDRMKPILTHFNVGDKITASWDVSTSTIEFFK